MNNPALSIEDSRLQGLEGWDKHRSLWILEVLDSRASRDLRNPLESVRYIADLLSASWMSGFASLQKQMVEEVLEVWRNAVISCPCIAETAKEFSLSKSQDKPGLLNLAAAVDSSFRREAGVSFVEELVRDGVDDINQRDRMGKTPLMNAVGCSETVRFLLEQGADACAVCTHFSRTDYNDYSPRYEPRTISEYAQRSAISRASNVLRPGRDDDPPAILANLEGCNSELRASLVLLLDYLRDGRQESVDSASTATRPAGATEELVWGMEMKQSRADAQALINEAFVVAAYYENPEALRILRSAGANPDHKIRFDAPRHLNSVDAVTVAAHIGSKTSLDVLVREFGLPVTEEARIAGKRSGNDGIVECISAASDATALDTIAYTIGYLADMVKNQRWDEVRRAIASAPHLVQGVWGADTGSLSNEEGYRDKCSPVNHRYTAVNLVNATIHAGPAYMGEHSSAELVESLLRLGGTLSPEPIAGEGPHYEIVRTDRIEQPLSIAARRGYFYLGSRLLQMFAPPDSEHDTSPLVETAKRVHPGRSFFAEMLLEAGADRDAVDEAGKTALDYVTDRLKSRGDDSWYQQRERDEDQKLLEVLTTEYPASEAIRQMSVDITRLSSDYNASLVRSIHQIIPGRRYVYLDIPLKGSGERGIFIFEIKPKDQESSSDAGKRWGDFIVAARDTLGSGGGTCGGLGIEAAKDFFEHLTPTGWYFRRFH